MNYKLDIVNGLQGMPYYLDEDDMRVNWGKASLTQW